MCPFLYALFRSHIIYYRISAINLSNPCIIFLAIALNHDPWSRNIYTIWVSLAEYLGTHVCFVEVLQVRMKWSLAISSLPMPAKGSSGCPVMARVGGVCGLSTIVLLFYCKIVSTVCLWQNVVRIWTKLFLRFNSCFRLYASLSYNFYSQWCIISEPVHFDLWLVTWCLRLVKIWIVASMFSLWCEQCCIPMCLWSWALLEKHIGGLPGLPSC